MPQSDHLPTPPCMCPSQPLGEHVETLCPESLAVWGHDHGGERMGTLEFIPAGWPDRQIECKGRDIPSQIHSAPLAWPAC